MHKLHHLRFWVHVGFVEVILTKPRRDALRPGPSLAPAELMSTVSSPTSNTISRVPVDTAVVVLE